MPGISTASLPDIVFMLLFFFMVTAVVKEVTPNMVLNYPQATQSKKLEDGATVSHVYIGKPRDERLGTEPRIFLNDSFKDVDAIADFVASEKSLLSELDQRKMIVNLNIDKEVKMGVVVDVKQALRRAEALKVNYKAKQVSELR